MISDSIVRNIWKNLVQFGYTDLTEAETREAVDKLEAGENPTEIIGMMARNMLVENGLLPDD